MGFLLAVTVLAVLGETLRAGDNTPPAGSPPPCKDCTSTPPNPDTLNKARCALETLRKAIEEWGTLTVSEPLVVVDVGQFSLEGDISDPKTQGFESTAQYIARARSSSVQGGATQVQESSVSNGLNVEVTPTFSVDFQGKKTAAPTPDPSTAGTFTPPTTGTPENLATPTTAGGLLRAPAAADGKTPSGFQLSDAVAVPMGESAKITELLGRQMSHPTRNPFTNPDVTVHFAIVQISCNPGWRTRENYIGDLSATCEYYRLNSCQAQPESDQVRPLVFSVLPLFDAQTLELASSERQVANLVTQLAAAYPTSAARLRAADLLKLAKQYQSDVATRTPHTITNSYSTGSSFGFRFAPSLVALKDPAQRHSGATNILQATSFPALVTIVINERHAHDNKYDSVLVHIAHHWLINDRPPVRNFWRRWALPLKRDSVEDDYDLTQVVQNAHDAVNQIVDLENPRIGPKTHAGVAMLYRQFKELRSKAVGSSRPVFCFPWSSPASKTDAPIISGVTPTQVIGTGPVTLFVRGFHFSGITEVWLGQRPGIVRIAGGNGLKGEQLIVNFAAASASAPVPDAGALPLIVVGPNGFDAKPEAVTIIKAVATQPTVKDGAKTTNNAAPPAPAATTNPAAAPAVTPAPSTDSEAAIPGDSGMSNTARPGGMERKTASRNVAITRTLPVATALFAVRNAREAVAVAADDDWDPGLPAPWKVPRALEIDPQRNVADADLPTP